MCGIAGYNLTKEGVECVDKSLITQYLLWVLEDRGKDAVGLAWYGRDGGIGIQKQPGKPTDLQHFRYGKQTDTVIIHSRLATQGKPEINRNNHPMIAWTNENTRKMIAGIHNGIIDNDWRLEHELDLDRYAVTDSDVIFQILGREGYNNPSALEKIEGSLAIAYLVEGSQQLYLAKGYTSPLVIHETPVGVFFCSVSIAKHLPGILGIQESDVSTYHSLSGEWYSFKNGICSDVGEFKPSFAKWSNSSTKPYGGYSGSYSSGYTPINVQARQEAAESVISGWESSGRGEYDYCEKCFSPAGYHDVMCPESKDHDNDMCFACQVGDDHTSTAFCECESYCEGYCVWSKWDKEDQKGNEADKLDGKGDEGVLDLDRDIYTVDKAENTVGLDNEVNNSDLVREIDEVLTDFQASEDPMLFYSKSTHHPTGFKMIADKLLGKEGKDINNG